MTGFGDKVDRTERDLVDAAGNAAVKREREKAERLRHNEAAALAFADLLEEVSRTLHSRGARATRERVRVPRYGVAKTKMGRLDFHTRTFKGWTLGSGFRQIWIEVGGGHWTDDGRYPDTHYIDFPTVRRARDPRPIRAIYQMDGSRKWRPFELSVLPRDVTWSAAGGFRLVYTYTSGRDGPSTLVDADYEETLAGLVAAALVG